MPINNTAAPRPYFPASADELPEIEYLPDLFTFFDGRKVTSPEDWAERREELRDMLQYYLYGYRQNTPEEASRLRILSESERDAMTRPPFFPGFPSVRPEAVAEITLPGSGKTAAITLDAFRVPEKGVNTEYDAPYPAVICIGMLAQQQVETLLENGYAYIAMDTMSVYSDGADNPRTGAYCELYPYREGVYEFDSGVLLGWAWGVSRIIDVLKNDPALAIAWNQCAVTGCSRNGKAAALAAAFDDRVALAAPSSPGGGGLTGFRYSTEGQLHNYSVPRGHDIIYSRNESAQRAIANPSESAWFCSKAQMFTHAGYKRAPFDLHAVAALVAPRPFICWTGETHQAWLNSPATALNIAAAREAYEFLGAGGNIACVVQDGPHANQDRDLPALIAIMDRLCGRRDKLEIRVFDTLRGEDGAAKDGGGAFRPAGTLPDIAAFSRNPYDMENQFIRWARPGKYTLWSEDKYLTAGIKRTLTFHTDAPYIIINGERLAVSGGSVSYEFIPPYAGHYTVTTDGGESDSNSLELACFTKRESLRYGLNLTSGSPDGMAVGFTSPVTGEPEAYVDGRRLTASVYDDGTAETYLERYGVSLKPNGIPQAARFTFELRNFGLEALPGYTFSVSVELYKTKVKNWFGTETDALAADCGEQPMVMDAG